MGALLLVSELLIVFVLTLFLLHKYGDWRKQSAIVTTATFIGWYFSFTIIFVLPLDVSITFYNHCLSEQKITNASIYCEKPQGYVSDDLLLRLWRVVYWTSQALTWLILPLLQSYVNAGDFTVSARLKSAVRNNAIYYGIYLVIFIAILIYAIAKGVGINPEHLKIILISASNTWGLFLLVVLLGYGLVELPRSLWNKGSKYYRLQKTYFDIEQLATEKSETEENVKQLYRETRKILNSLQNEHGGRELVKIILDKFPVEVVEELFPARSATEFSGVSTSKLYNSDQFLVAHHKYVISAVQSYKRVSSQWRHMMEKAMFMEDCSIKSGPLEPPPGSIVPKGLFTIWHVHFKHCASKFSAVFLSTMTVLILLSECTFFMVHPTLSPAALVMNFIAQRFHYKYTQFVAIGIILYLCSCAYLTVFRLKIYKYYHLYSHHNTDENSLLFSATLICRLTSPLCLNFLGMIHLDSHITKARDFGAETQFTRLMGHLDVLPILSKGIDLYLPMCILIFCAVNYYKLATRILHSIGIDQFVADDNITQDMVEGGKALVQLHRNSLNRRRAQDRRGEMFHDRVAGRNRGLNDESAPILDSLEEDHFMLRTAPFQPPEHPSSANFFDDL